MNKTLAFLGVIAALAAASTVAQSAATSVAVSKFGLSGTTHFAAPGLNAPHVAMQAFDLRFTNGDHKIQSIGVMPEKNALRTAFRDHDGNDGYDLRARFLNSPWPNGKIAKRSNCKNSCALALQNPYAGDGGQFVLSGFRLTRKTGDSNVRQIKIRPSADRKQLEVAFRDNGGFLFDVEVAYTFMPRASFAAYGTKVLRRAKKEEYVSVGQPSKGPPILQGFDVEFENGDHHLKELAVVSGNGYFIVRFNDNNYDDPYRATIDWGVMKP